MPEEMQRRLIMLFCLHTNGDMPGASNNELLTAFRIKPFQFAKTFEIFRQKGFIDDEWNLLNWEKRQYSSDNVSMRVRKYREKEKKRDCNVTETLLKRKCNVLDTDTDTDTERDKRLTSFPDGNGSRPPCPHSEIVDLYHENLPELPRVARWGEKRRTALRARWNEDGERQQLDWWRAYFLKVKASDFLIGKTAGRSWKASLEWLINPSNLLKVIEGNYDNMHSNDDDDLVAYLESKFGKEDPSKHVA